MASKLIPLAPPELPISCDTAIDDALAHLELPSPEEPPEKEDACSYLFKLCKRLDSDFLQQRGIACEFDVSGGWLPGATCRTVGLMVAALVIDLAARARVRPKHGLITISLHRWGDIWACSVSDSGIYAVRPHPSRPPEIVQRLARSLNARLRHQPTEDGGMTAFMFEPIRRAIATG